MEYNSKRIPIGINENGDVVHVNVEKCSNILFIGNTGTGKTWLTQTIISRACAAGMKPVILSDLLKEYIYAKEPLQKNFRQFLLPGEEPQGLKMFYDNISSAECIDNGVPILSLPEKAFLEDKSILSHKVGLAIKNLIMSKKNNDKLLLVLEKAHLFCPKIETNFSKEMILDALDFGRVNGLGFISCTCDFRRVSEQLFKQSSYVCFAHNTSLSDAVDILKEKAPYEYDFPTSFSVDVANRIGQMRIYKDGTRDWLMIDVDKKDNFIFKPLAPLSHFRTEEDEEGVKK
jgi:hypothetical protein